MRQYFNRHKKSIEIVDFIVIETLDQFKPALKKIKQNKDFDTAIIGSGDGTIVAIINALKDRDVTYGLIPLGTSNTFVRSLGLPLDVNESLRAITSGRPQPVSLGSINGTLFINIADIGIAVDVADNVTDRIKKYLGTAAYIVSGIRALSHHDAISCSLTIDGKTQEFHTHHLFIANGRNRGPIEVRGSSVFSSHLLIGYSSSKHRLDYLRDALSLILGKTKKRKTAHIRNVTSATLTTKPPKTIQADGEIIGKTPAKISIKQNAISVLIPEKLLDQKGKPRKTRPSRSPDKPK